MEPDYFVKRKGQLYVETWHGGLGDRTPPLWSTSVGTPKFLSPKGFNILWRKES